ncbi:MAG: nicotinamide riboside transporter PnuC, partial [Saprospiraceae bacterium]|nr:nicotinamide riboside transporter PnuC [Saprospiraceae bacterium]
VGTAALGYGMGHYFGASLSYFDAFTTMGSFIAQYLLARKILQNWLLWIIVDVVAVSVYTYKGIYIIAGLFAVYLVLCIKGYADWKKSLRQQVLATT